MTREEAIEELKKVDTLDAPPRLCKAHWMSIKALEQGDVLDKIRAEIDVARFIDKDTKLCKNANASGLEVAMQIIDKYKAESEDKE